MSQAAKSNEMYIIGGSIPEICDDKVYNTCTVWDPQGNMIAKHRKVLNEIWINYVMLAKNHSSQYQ